MIRSTFPQITGTVLSTTNETVVYTAPDSQQSSLAYIEYVRVVNTDASAVDVTIAWRDSSAATTYNLAYQYPLDPEDTLTLDCDFVIEAGDTIRVTAGTGNVLHVTTVFYETQGRSS